VETAKDEEERRTSGKVSDSQRAVREPEQLEICDE